MSDLHVFTVGTPPRLLADLPTTTKEVDGIIANCLAKECTTVDEEGEFASPGETVYRVILPGHQTTVWTQDQLYNLVK